MTNQDLEKLEKRAKEIEQELDRAIADQAEANERALRLYDEFWEHNKALKGTGVLCFCGLAYEAKSGYVIQKNDYRKKDGE